MIKEWKRGTPLSSAELVFEGKEADMSVSASLVHERGYGAALVLASS